MQRNAFLLLVFSLAFSVLRAADPVPSWIVEETSGTVRLIQSGKFPKTLRTTDSVPLFQGDRLIVGNASLARVFDGRESRALLPQDNGAARTYTAPAPPADSSIFARLLADAANRKDHRTAAGVIVRIPGDLKCQFVVPAEGHLFTGQPPAPVILVTAPLTTPHALVVRGPGDSKEPPHSRFAIPSDAGEHRLAWDGTTKWQEGESYVLSIESGGEVLAEKEIRCATPEERASLEQDRRALLQELADSHVNDTAAALRYLDAAYQFLIADE